MGFADNVSAEKVTRTMSVPKRDRARGSLVERADGAPAAQSRLNTGVLHYRTRGWRMTKTKMALWKAKVHVSTFLIASCYWHSWWTLMILD